MNQSNKLKTNSGYRPKLTFLTSSKSTSDSESESDLSKTTAAPLPEESDKQLKFKHFNIQAGFKTGLEKSGLINPSPIQISAFKEIMASQKVKELSRMRNSFILNSETGSGKTLAYMLPVLSLMKLQEKIYFENSEFKTEKEYAEGLKPSSPRILILTPSRELTKQTETVAKSLCHIEKFKVIKLLGGQKTDKFRAMESKLRKTRMDMLISTPGYVYKLWEKQSLYLGKVKYIVIDEADSLLGKKGGFHLDLDKIIPVLLNRKGTKVDKPMIIFVGATVGKNFKVGRDQSDDSYQRITKYCQILYEKPYVITPEETATNKSFGSVIATSKKYKEGSKVSINYSGVQEDRLRNTNVSELVGLSSKLKLSFVKCQSKDRRLELEDAVSSWEHRVTNKLILDPTMTKKVVIFCNNVATAKAIYQIVRNRTKNKITNVLTLHNEMNDRQRKLSYSIFGSEKNKELKNLNFLITTDIAARGIDFGASIDEVIMYDVPRSVADFVHRAGRTGRLEKETVKPEKAHFEKGKVTVLVSSGKYERTLVNSIRKELKIDGKLNDVRKFNEKNEKKNPTRNIRVRTNVQYKNL